MSGVNTSDVKMSVLLASHTASEMTHVHTLEIIESSVDDTLHVHPWMYGTVFAIQQHTQTHTTSLDSCITLC